MKVRMEGDYFKLIEPISDTIYLKFAYEMYYKFADSNITLYENINLDTRILFLLQFYDTQLPIGQQLKYNVTHYADVMWDNKTIC